MIQKGSLLSDIFRNKFIKITLADVILFSAGIFILFINPALKLFGTGCIFQKTTGYQCAGCGMSRGIYSLLRGDIASAAEYNLLLVTAVPAAIIYYITRKLNIINNIAFWEKADRIVFSLFAVIVVVFTMARNI